VGSESLVRRAMTGKCRVIAGSALIEINRA